MGYKCQDCGNTKRFYVSFVCHEEGACIATFEEGDYFSDRWELEDITRSKSEEEIGEKILACAECESENVVEWHPNGGKVRLLCANCEGEGSIAVVGRFSPVMDEGKPFELVVKDVGSAHEMLEALPSYRGTPRLDRQMSDQLTADLGCVVVKVMGDTCCYKWALI